jgi:hypothetical protein
VLFAIFHTLSHWPTCSFSWDTHLIKLVYWGVESNWVHSALRLLIGLLCQPRVIMMMEKLVELLAAETEVLGENLPSAALSNTNPTCCPDTNPGRRGGKPATNRLSYGRVWDTHSLLQQASIYGNYTVLTPWSVIFPQKLMVPQLIKIFIDFMDPKGSLPCSQQLATILSQICPVQTFTACFKLMLCLPPKLCV